MRLSLVNKEFLVDNIWAFRFQPSEPLQWTAGQYIEVNLSHDNPDDRGTKRWFTVSSAPFESVVQITTRIVQSSFKKALADMEIGDSLELTGLPEGDFVWRESELPRIFIAGGIGVTPFYSILKQRFHDGLPLNTTLIYNSRTPEVPFINKLTEWQGNDSTFTLKRMIGERLSAESLLAIAPGLNESLIYLSGPETMVEAIGEAMKQGGLPEGQLVQDFFPNYTAEDY